jgi:hypothetical protein
MKPLLRIGMELATVRYVAAGEPIADWKLIRTISG